MDIMAFVGLILGLVFVVIGILLGGDVASFVDLASIMIVMGGTVAAAIMNYSFDQFKKIGTILKISFSKKSIDYNNTIKTMINLANTARREGVLALEEEADRLEDTFLKKGVMLIVDGSDPELVKNIMETEMSFVEDRHGQGQAMLLSMASYAPAFGMIGTLIGLINMLKMLSNPDSLGPAMAVALITTFYGSMLSNLFFTPLAGRLKEKTSNEIRHKEMMLEGILSIQAGENPRIIEEKLKAFLPLKMQLAISTNNSEEGA